MNRPSPLAPILEKYPSFIPLPIIARPHRSASANFKDIVKANQLPSRFFFGNVIDNEFNRDDKGWEAIYKDPEGYGSTIITYKNKGAKDDPSLYITNEWRGIEHLFWMVPPDSFNELGDKVAQAYAEGWDEHAAQRLCSRYNLEYLPNQLESYILCGIPDGFFRSLAVPLPVHMLRKAYNCHVDLQRDPKIHAGVVCGIHLCSSVVNYVVGKNSDVLSNPNHIFLKTIHDLGRPPQFQPVEESADDGSSAITNRREHYLLVIGFTLRDMDRVVEVMHSYGLIGDRDQRLTNDDYPHAPEYAAVVVQSGLETQPIEFNYYDEEQRRRTYYHQFSEFRNVAQIKESEGVDARPLIEQAELAMEEMYECVLGVMKKW
jgi:hypothetical protein